MGNKDKLIDTRTKKKLSQDNTTQRGASTKADEFSDTSHGKNQRKEAEKMGINMIIIPSEKRNTKNPNSFSKEEIHPKHFASIDNDNKGLGKKQLNGTLSSKNENKIGGHQGEVTIGKSIEGFFGVTEQTTYVVRLGKYKGEWVSSMHTSL